LGLEKPNSGPDPGETFFPNSVSDETFPKSRNVGPVIDENVCLLDSQPWLQVWAGEQISSCLDVKMTKKQMHKQADNTDEQLHRWTDEQVKIFLKVFYQFYQTILNFRAFKSHEKIRQ
jgi:hypothetical protein